MKQFKIFCCLIVLGLTFSCSKKDDVIADSDKPVIAIISPTSAVKVNGTVSITATVTDNDGLSKVQVYLDNSLLQEFTDGNVSISWDSKTVSDGAHTIKVTATDKSANVAEGTLNITVRNTLIEFAVPAGYIGATDDYWIFLSDKSGKVWDTKQLLNGQTYKFNPTTSFTADSITMSLFKFTDNPNYQDFNGNTTYANIPLGKYHFHSVVNSTVPTITGTAKVVISDAPGWDYLTKLTSFGQPYNYPAVYPGTPAGLEFDYTLHYGHNRELFIDRNTVPGKYMLLDLVPTANIVKTLANDFLPLSVLNISVPQGITDGNYYFQGNINGEYAYIDDNQFTLNGSTSFKINYPPINFDSYVTYMYVTAQNGSIGYISTSSSLPSQLKVIDAAFVNTSLKGNTINYSANGTFDYVLAGATEVNNALYISSTIYLGDKPTNTVKVPELPSEIKAKYSWAKSFSELHNGYFSVYNYDTYTGYTDLINSDLVSDEAKPSNEITYKSTGIIPNNGRLNMHQLPDGFPNPALFKH